MIRKLRKARWVYRCSPCDYTSPASVDLFGAQESGQRHRGSLGHLQNNLVEAFKPLVDYLKKFAEAVGQTQDAFALVPPPNIPHDPSLRRDRRKWGGQ